MPILSNIKQTGQHPPFTQLQRFAPGSLELLNDQSPTGSSSSSASYGVELDLEQFTLPQQQYQQPQQTTAMQPPPGATMTWETATLKDIPRKIDRFGARVSYVHTNRRYFGTCLSEHQKLYSVAWDSVTHRLPFSPTKKFSPGKLRLERVPEGVKLKNGASLTGRPIFVQPVQKKGGVSKGSYVQHL